MKNLVVAASLLLSSTAFAQSAPPIPSVMPTGPQPPSGEEIAAQAMVQIGQLQAALGQEKLHSLQLQKALEAAQKQIGEAKAKSEPAR